MPKRKSVATRLQTSKVKENTFPKKNGKNKRSAARNLVSAAIKENEISSDEEDEDRSFMNQVEVADSEDENHNQSSTSSDDDDDKPEKLSEEAQKAWEKEEDNVFFPLESDEEEENENTPGLYVRRRGNDTESDDEDVASSAQSVAGEETGQVEDMMLEGKSKEELLRLADMLDSGSEPENEEELLERNTIGNVPLEWYDDYDHIGYNLKGQKILKKEAKDELDNFLAREENPAAAWRTVYDHKNQREITLSRRDVDLLMRVVEGGTPSAEEPFQHTIELETRGGGIHPVTNKPAPKSRFIPSKWEAKRVAYLAQAIRRGWINVEDWHKERKPYDPGELPLELLWEDDEALSPTARKRAQLHIPAPRLALPGHAQSYNPPSEYLLTPEERKEAFRNADHPGRLFPTLPKQYSAMRLIPAYQPFVRERFERCLDLYLCPRTVKLRRNVDPKDLLPNLPKPSELRPFPERKALTFRGHTDRVRSISADPTGQWLASASDDKTVRIWEISSGRCLCVAPLPVEAYSVAWNPNPNRCVVAVGTKAGDVLFMVPPHTVVGEVLENSKRLVNVRVKAVKIKEEKEGAPKRRGGAQVYWQNLTAMKSGSKFHAVFGAHVHQGALPVKRLSWHIKGDYLAAVCEYNSSTATKEQIRIHRLSAAKTQSPFRKLKGQVQAVHFHPQKPILFVATQRYVRLYDLQKQALHSKLQPGVQFISAMAVHPTGDHVLIGSYDRRVCWFDLDLSKRPYRTLRYHRLAVRSVAFHRMYPLYSSVGDDGKLHLFHARVYDDLLHNPLLVPLRSLPAHQVVDQLGVLDCCFHPTQPWAFTSGADGDVHLFS